MTSTEISSVARKTVSELFATISSKEAERTLAKLIEIGTSERWSYASSRNLEFFCAKFDIAKRLLNCYGADGRGMPSSGEVSESTYEVFTALIILDIHYLNQTGEKPFALKRINTLFKLLERSTPSWISEGTLLSNEVCSIESSISADRPLATLVDVPEIRLPDSSIERRTIPWTVLFYEGPIARAYLETLKSLNMRPEKIVQLVPERDLQNGKKIGRWVPGGVRASYAAIIQKSKIHYWPKKIEKEQREMCDSIFSEVSRAFKFDIDVQNQSRALLPIDDYSDDVETIMFDGLDDQHLKIFIEENITGNVLFTGGGIVPNSLLEITSINLIHIHPGFLPHIRGADCVLWSQLLAGHMSASCFYMSPGIDTGDVVRAMWMPRLKLNQNSQSIDPKTLYRSVYSFIDPWVRAYALRSVLSDFSEISRMPSQPQSGLENGAFNFMHEQTSLKALRSLFGITVL